MAANSSSGFSSGDQNSGCHQLMQNMQVPKKQSSPRPSRFLHHNIFLKCCVRFTPEVTGHSPSRNVPILSGQSKEYFLNSLGNNRKMCLYLSSSASSGTGSQEQQT
ncbi:hypothetical protein GOODEAATRI_007313 [Goodea atripinnis]|uniref:Uncharacterized protein n=1 Tax=Goodea atripinnis TaxID=208336 RepID=A0ABV0MQ09_9TELE